MSETDRQIAAIELLLATTDTDDPTRAGLEARLAKLRGHAGRCAARGSF